MLEYLSYAEPQVGWINKPKSMRIAVQKLWVFIYLNFSIGVNLFFNSMKNWRS